MSEACLSCSREKRAWGWEASRLWRLAQAWPWVTLARSAPGGLVTTGVTVSSGSVFTLGDDDDVREEEVTSVYCGTERITGFLAPDIP